MSGLLDRAVMVKLNEANYGIWKSRMERLLRYHGVWGTVINEGAPGDGVADNIVAEWQTKKDKAMGIMSIHMEDEQQNLIDDVYDPHDAWNNIKTHHQKDTLVQKLRLRRQLYQMSYAEGQSVLVYINSVKDVAKQLIAIGVNIPDTELAQVLLMGFVKVPGYSPLLTALGTVNPENLTAVYVTTKLLEEEERQKDCNELSGHVDDVALYAKSKGSKSTKKTCYYCGQPDHIKPHCADFQRDKKNGTLHPDKVKRKTGTMGGQSGTASAKVAQEDSTKVESDDCLWFAAANVAAIQNSTDWLIDSGATHHMTPCKEQLTDYIAEKKCVKLGDGHTVDSNGHGKVKLLLSDSRKTVTLSHVLYVPCLTVNLFSVSDAMRHNLSVLFCSTGVIVRTMSGSVAATGQFRNNMYILNATSISEPSTHVASIDETELWHKRLGHPNDQVMKVLIDKKAVSGIKMSSVNKLDMCNACIEGKMTRKPFPRSETQSDCALDLIHSDVCGPMKVASFGGRRYFVTFLDDYTHCVAVYIITKKSEVLSKFIEFVTERECQSGQKVKILRSDNGGEYTGQAFREYCSKKGIIQQFTNAHTPQQNGKAERMNRTLVECARTMMAEAQLPKSYWAEAILTATYVKNRTPSKTTDGKTPFERWYGKKPYVGHFRVFGCLAYVHIPKVDRNKFDSKATLCRFIGYSLNRKGYKLYNEEERKVVYSRDVQFKENVFCKDQYDHLEISSKADVNTKTVQPAIPEIIIDGASEEENEDSEPEAAVDDPQNVRRSTRIRKKTQRYSDSAYQAACLNCSVEADTEMCFVCGVDEPTTMAEALKSNEAVEWKAAADSEYKSLLENDTWELVPLPQGRKAITCKWVFRKKHNVDGTVERYKARLVARGFVQERGIDYEETFAPVARSATIRTLLAVAVQRNMEVHQMDVTTAFLHGELNEEVYMTQPEGYVQKGSESLVCKLKKSLYGLKQAPRCWNLKLHDYLVNIGYKQSPSEPCLYTRKEKNRFEALCVYVDDLLLIAENSKEMTNMKNELSCNFKMKDLGQAHYCLGIEIHYNKSSGEMTLDQSGFVKKILEKTDMIDSKPINTPMEFRLAVKEKSEDEKPFDKTKYRSLIGMLLYVALGTRPDIAYSVGVLAKFSENPTETHWKYVQRVLRYLKSTINFGLKYHRLSENTEIVGYCDADWGGDENNRRSTSGIVMLLGNSLINWSSKKQSMVALSTTEAEYIAATSACQEITWLRRIVEELQLKQPEAITLYEDNAGCIQTAKNPIFHARTKHFDIKLHYIRQQIHEGRIALHYIESKEQLADIMTKQINRQQFEHIRKNLGIVQVGNVKVGVLMSC